MKHRVKRIVSALSAVALMGYVVPIFPFLVFAEEGTEDNIMLETAFDEESESVPMVLTTIPELNEEEGNVNVDVENEINYENILYSEDFTENTEVKEYQVTSYVYEETESENVVETDEISLEVGSNETTYVISEDENLEYNESEVNALQLNTVFTQLSKDTIDESPTKTADITFVIDSTGSMEEYINSVKQNLTNFVNSLNEKGIALNMSVAEYRDIEEDGANSTVYYAFDGSYWTNDINKREFDEKRIEKAAKICYNENNNRLRKQKGGFLYGTNSNFLRYRRFLQRL